jgi:hypothetical protein
LLLELPPAFLQAAAAASLQHLLPHLHAAAAAAGLLLRQ